jgi:hypothetical protein
MGNHAGNHVLFSFFQGASPSEKRKNAQAKHISRYRATTAIAPKSERSGTSGVSRTKMCERETAQALCPVKNVGHSLREST